MKKGIVIFPIILLLIFISSCVSFPRQNYLHVNRNDFLGKTSINITYQIETQHSNVLLDESIHNIIEKFLNETHYFKQHYCIETGLKPKSISSGCMQSYFPKQSLKPPEEIYNNYEKFHLKVYYERELQTNPYITTLNAIISLCTLGIIPGYERNNLIITIDVFKDNKFIKRYSYKREVETWVQIFLILKMKENSIEKVFNRVIEDMLVNFLLDTMTDGIFQK